MRSLQPMLWWLSASLVVLGAPPQIFMQGLAPSKTPADDPSFLREWSRKQKQHFLRDLERDEATSWLLCIGNEAGDTDSLVSALAYSYHLSHLAKHPKQAIALLQRDKSFFGLRPENDLALKHSHLKHEDLLTLSDLPFRRSEVASRIGGLVLTDHNQLLSEWGAIGERRVVSIIDHHRDKGLYPHASPRVFEMTQSCTTLIAREILFALHKPHHLPQDLVDLMLHTIALDTSDFKHGSKKDTLDHQIAHSLLPFSSWSGHNLEKVIKELDDKMTTARNDLSHLSVFDLFRRDWKGDLRRSQDGHAVHLGFASVPMSLPDQIKKTPTQTPDEYFQIESNWTLSIQADVSVCLNSYKDAEGTKQRDLILVVKAVHRLNEDSARDLFNKIVEEVEANTVLNVTEWKEELGESGHKRMVWHNHGGKQGGRKTVRPLVENAVADWLSDHPHY